MEDLVIRRRNTLRHHYTQTSNVLLFGYRDLSDGAKLSYQVIDSFDWADGAGLRKGFAHPSLGRLASIRGVEKRSVRRHLAELERVRLITRKERPGRPNLLIIEDPSQEEADAYLRSFGGLGEDKIVRPTPDKIVRSYKEEEKRKERQILVNEEQALSGVAKPMVSPNTWEAKAKREYLAQEILNVVHDEKSLGYYRSVAETIEPHRIFEALSEVRLASREGRIRTNRGAYFTSVIERPAMYSRDRRGANQEQTNEP